ncbi:colanic acid biosynthesis glycosyltransferase WcaE, partial [Escherichia sp. HC-CC]
MLLSIITVAFRNLEGIVKTHASLAHLAQVEDTIEIFQILTGAVVGTAI